MNHTLQIFNQMLSGVRNSTIQLHPWRMLKSEIKNYCPLFSGRMILLNCLWGVIPCNNFPA